MTDNSAVDNETENDLLTHYLAGRDVPCPTCGYNLRDLRGDQCPECGHSLEVTIRVNDGSMTRWVWAFASSCLSVPLGILYGIISVVTLIDYSSSVSVDYYIWMYLFTGVFLIGTVIAIILLIKQVRFLRCSVHLQTWMMRLIVTYNFAALTAFILFVFFGS